MSFSSAGTDAFRERWDTVIFRQFCTPDDEISYLVADPVSRYAAVLDPHIEAEREYIQVVHQLDLRLVYLVETHIHESHLSAAPALQIETGARLVTHSVADSACVGMRVDDGESIFVGEEYISVMATPGHSPCSLSFMWRDRVFTGHTLLSGVTGPCQRGDADAGRLFDSVRDRLFELPDEMLVYPGRVAGSRRVSSIGQERATNADLQPQMTRAQFVARKRAEASSVSVWKEGSLAANQRCKVFN
jgi:glyoxylase-like metal-dependent hydrolase (beta-lactamase superfamily II)